MKTTNTLPYTIDYLIKSEDKELGKGSFGKVFKSFNPDTKKNIAIKMIEYKGSE